MQKIEDQLNNAIEAMKKGKTRLSGFSHSKFNGVDMHKADDLSALLGVVKIAMTLPKNQAPAPEKQYRFMAVRKQPSKFKTFIKNFKGVYAFSLASLLLLIVAGIGYAANFSLPGEKLFTLKKGYENTRLYLTSNAEARMQLQLTYLDARIQDAQKTLDTNAASSVQTEAALELSRQAQALLDNYKTVAANSPTVTKNSTLLNKVESLTKQQQTLVAKINPGIAQKTDSSTQTALNDLKAAYTAANNDQSVAALPQNTDFDVTGQVSAISLKRGVITIGKTDYFFASDKISVQDSTGTLVYIGLINIGDTLEIKGKDVNGQNNAGTIVLKEKAKVKPSPAPTSGSNPSPTPTAVDQSKPQDTFGGYIPEQTILLPEGR